MTKYCISLLTFLFCGFLLHGQTQNDTVKAFFTATPITIDGQADENCWQAAEWHAIDQVMIPWNATMEPGDFEGRFKVAWDNEYLYVLVEVVDDSISDDHSNPLSNWWDDDCCEVFIDEDRSKGGHECTNNAFAYHVSIFYDAIDMSPSCGGINYKNHVQVVMDTIGENLYQWEMAFNLYNSTYNNSNPEASRVFPEHRKLMGFAIAYCDNDETTGRENFIGTQKLTSATANDLYKNASLFGPMLLINPDLIAVHDQKLQLPDFHLAVEGTTLKIDMDTKPLNEYTITIHSITGVTLKKVVTSSQSNMLNISEYANGLYIVNISDIHRNVARKFVKQ